MIGENYDHYRELWIADYRHKVMEEPKQKVEGAFNWMALFLGFVWFAYRRMYGFVFCIVMFFVGLSFVAKLYDLDIIAMLAVWLGMAICSKDLYLSHLVVGARKISALPNRERQERFLRWRKGTSYAFAFSVGLLFVTLNLIAIILAVHFKQSGF